MARWAIRHFGDVSPRSNAMLLDIGCGYGAQTRWLDEAGFSVHAIDASAPAIERLRLRYTGGAVIRHADVCDMAVYPDGLFHGVVDVCCLQHVEAIERAIAEIARVLRPSGRLFSMMRGITTGHDSADDFGYMRLMPSFEAVAQMFHGKQWAKINIGRMINMPPDNIAVEAHWIVDAVRA
jgi:ubiquinone/menaquinone biosynthesis C-methylase UbiE